MIRYLKTFIEAAHTGSFSATGSKLGLTQSAVSTQILRLEQDLGCQLFERSARSISLSAAGKALLPTAVKVVTLYLQMQSRQGNGGIEGRIQIGAISSAQLGLMPQALSGLKSRFPLVEVTILPGMSIQFLHQIQARDIDLALMIRPSLRLPRDLVWTPVLREPYVAIAPAGTTQTDVRTLLSQHAFIRYNRYSHGGQAVDQYLRKHRLAVRETMELDEPGVIVRMVEQELGVAIIPATLALHNAATNVRVVALARNPIYREVGVLQPLGARANPIATALIESIIKVADELPFRNATYARVGRGDD